jgi:hypothetical protein
MTTLAVVKVQKGVGVSGGVKGADLWRSSRPLTPPLTPPHLKWNEDQSSFLSFVPS